MPAPATTTIFRFERNASVSFFNFASWILLSASSNESPKVPRSRYSVVSSLGFVILCFFAGGGPSRDEVSPAGRCRRDCDDERSASETLLDAGDG